MGSPSVFDGETDPVPRSVRRVLDAFETVLAEGSCNLTTVARATDLTPTTALRHLRALEARGYLARDAAGDFSAGPRILRIAASLNGNGPLDRLVAAAQPHLDLLAVATGESSYLAVGDGVVATYVATAESTRMIRHVGWVGQDVPVSGTAVGEALAEPGVVHTRTGAVEPDVTAVSIGLSDHVGLTAALSVIGPAGRLVGDELRRIEATVLRAAEELVREFGDDLPSSSSSSTSSSSTSTSTSTSDDGVIR